jgi:hypothetical protein
MEHIARTQRQVRRRIGPVNNSHAPLSWHDTAVATTQTQWHDLASWRRKIPTVAADCEKQWRYIFESRRTLGLLRKCFDALSPTFDVLQQAA